MSARITFKSIRIVLLLLLLAAVSYQTWHERWASTRWRVPLYVAIYPIAADDSPLTARYVDELDADQFKDIDRFFAREAARYHLALDTPVKTRLRARLTQLPPRRPADAGWLRTALFTLELRYWAFRHSGHVADPEDIRIFVLYHDPQRTPVVPHSLGLSKGLLGVVYAFASASMDGANNIVISHELLHTLGATDKYDPSDDAPRFPDGYGDPQQRPLFPQRYAELMAGRRMLAPRRWVQPASLEEVLIGPASALEIRWRGTPDAPALRDQLSASRTMAWSAGVAAASTEVESSPMGAPSRSVKTPRASITIAAQAAMSRMSMSVSTTMSMRASDSRW